MHEGHERTEDLSCQSKKGRIRTAKSHIKQRPVSLRGALPIGAVLALLVLFLCRGEVAGAGVRRGLALCTDTLFPSLFPFLVLSELLVAMGAGKWLATLFSKPMKKLFGLSGPASTAWLLGALCGFPTAMSTGVALLERGEITKAELRRLSLFANNPSAGFLVSAVGGALFGSRGAGLALFCITLSTSCLIGLLLQRFYPLKDTKNEEIPPHVMQKGLSASDVTGSVRRGFSGLLQVAAFLLFFSAVISCLRELPIMAALPAWVNALLTGCLEMTSGISLATEMLSAEEAFLITAFFAGFTGLSVCLQLASVTEGHDFNISQYLGVKLLHGTLNLLLARVYLRLARPLLSPARGAFAEGMPRVAHSAPLLIPSSLIFALCLAGGLLTWRRTQKGQQGKKKKEQ